MNQIVIAAGGTGGHVFPAATLAAELKARGHDIHVLTDHRGLRYMSAFQGAPFTEIGAGGVVGKSIIYRARSAIAILRGIFQARQELKKLRPAAVVGFGGYPSVPPLIAAWSLGIPTLLHEQNAVIGLANRPVSYTHLTLPTTSRV